MKRLHPDEDLDMSDDDLRVLVAEARGWIIIDRGPLPIGRMPTDPPSALRPLPELSLDEMHEAEETLDFTFPSNEADDYIKNLQDVIGGVPGCFAHHCASARERALAFVRTKKGVA